ncbi:MAG TPA: YtcA family lipoprotein [Candidatus Binatia bacterium]|nr:YtcA family lipoprotein [Candidatus Binatia bacterium]
MAALAALAAAGAAGCDPVFDVAGSFFPAWMLCLLIGASLAGLLRLVFARVGVEPYLGPLPVIYGALAALLTMTVWLALFRT